MKTKALPHICECEDEDCNACGGRCRQNAKVIVHFPPYEVRGGHMEPAERVALCEECALDAFNNVDGTRIVNYLTHEDV